MFPRDLGDLEVIELPDEPMANGDEPPQVEPLRWLLGDPVPPRQAPFARTGGDPIGAAGIWVALGGLRAPGRTVHHSSA